MSDPGSLIGTRVSTRYTVLEQLGAGGMAVVYRVHDGVTERAWALKAMRAELSHDLNFQRRFKAEHRVLASLDHPGIPAVQELNLTPDGLPCFAMELVEGENLEDDKQLDIEAVLALLAELMPILAHLHRQGLVHGDLKADNLMRNQAGNLKLMDFGLCGPAGARRSGVEGTLTHMAPELIQRSKADQRADLYAVGVILYQLLTGRLPLVGKTPAETLKLHLEASPPPPRRLRPEVPAELDALVSRLLSKRPQDRPQSANEVLRLAGLPAEAEDTLAVPLHGAFVGRKAALGALIAVIGDAAQGNRPKPWAVRGQAGFGKTRVLEEMSAQAQLMDLATLTGSCAPDPTPFGPWLDLARELLAIGRSVAPEQSALLQNALLPFNGQAASHSADPGALLRASLERLLDTIGTQQGLLILLDDWHLADAASVALLNHLLDSLTRRPIAWVITTQSDPPSGFQTVKLGPFSEAETASLIASGLGETTVPDAVQAQVFAAAQGSPRFTYDLLRYLLASKQLIKKQGGWTLVASSTSSLPSGLSALYEARVTALPKAAQTLAHVLALQGGPLPLAVLPAATGLDAARLDEAVADLLNRQDAQVGENGLALVDQQMATWLLGKLSDPEKQSLHTALADALGEIIGDNPPLRLLNALATHGLKGADPARYVAWLLSAARTNLAVSAFVEARDFAQATLAHGVSLTAPDRQDMFETLATSHRSLGHGDDALQVSQEAVRLAEELGDGLLLARSLNGLGKIHQLASRYNEARQTFEKAVEVAREVAPMEMARAFRALGRLATVSGGLEAAYQNGKEALRLCRRHGSSAELARFMAEIGETFQGSEEKLREGLALTEEAQAISQELQDIHLESFVANSLGNLRLSLGQLVGAKAAFTRAAELYEMTGNGGEYLFARLNLALVAEEQGYFAEAEQLAAGVTQEARRLNRKFPMAAALAIEGSAAGHMGRTVEGLARLAEASAIAEAINHRLLKALIQQIEAPLRCLLGQFDLAAEISDSLAKFGDTAGVPEFAQRGRLNQAEVSFLRGHLDEVQALLAPLARTPNVALSLRAQRLLSEMALQQGDEMTARAAYEAAQALIDEVDAPRETGLLWMLAARLEPPEQAVAAATQAVRVLETTQQRHSLPLALYVAAHRGAPKDRQASLQRASELIQAMAGALGENAALYLAAFDRQKILTESSLLPQIAVPLPETPVPTSLAGLQELAGRLLQGLQAFQEEANKSAVTGWGQERAAKRLEQIISFARVVNSSLQVDTVVDRALALIIEITGAERGLLLLKEGPAVVTQRFATAPGFDAEDAEAEQYSRTVARTVLETGETVCVLDALSDPRFAQQASVLGMNLQTIIAVPLKEQSEVIGAIYVDRQGLSDHFTQGDLEIVQVLAGLTAVALANARLMKQQMDNVLQLDQLNKLSRSVSRTLELEKVLDIISQVTLEIVKAERCLIFLWENEQLVFGSGRDHDGPLPAQAGRERSGTICQKVVDTLQPVHVIDTGQDAELATKKSVLNLKIASVVAVPLLADAGLTGVLYIDSRSRVSAALEKEVAVLQAIANTAALAVQNARHYREATVDHLTGLYVRSLFLRRIDEEVRRTRRFGGKFSLLVLDIDHFKRFNDTHGHQTGDAVLRMVARTIREAVRVGLDVPCRYGGEEMVVLLPETDAVGAVVTAERIRKQIETAGLPTAEGATLSVTVSIGVASFPAMASTATELFENADKALYTSKREGRNRVSLYTAEAPVS